ncbi:hypothetical protein XNC3_1070006 [Xenorhabdus nematophila F1]|nr:hypothetical protein XNC3_1070006 [Xenorhabdus nematophila F1]
MKFDNLNSVVFIELIHLTVQFNDMNLLGESYGGTAHHLITLAFVYKSIE